MGMFLNRGNEEFTRVLNSEIYVDKTDVIEFFNSLVNTEQAYVCVSRPRRFGKSITANMLAAYFEKGCDSRSLFQDKKLGQIKGWDRNLNRFDVIRIDVAELLSQLETPDKVLNCISENLINDVTSAYPDCGVDKRDTVAVALDKVNAKAGVQFIIIIDEWDAFFRDETKNERVQERYINLLYSIFKGNSSKKFTALAYITGILPIKKYSNESALNNFYEYTMMNPGPLAEYVGFTENEVRLLCAEYNMEFETANEWYDGYSFGNSQHIYGPNSVVRAMLSRHYDNYWSQTVAFNSLSNYITMNFDGLKDDIVEMIAGNKVRLDISGYENDMSSFKDKDDVMTALVHLGYLAYDAKEEKAYIPNKEVRQIFERNLKYTGWNEVADAINASELLLKQTIEGCDEDAVARQIDICHRQNSSSLKYNDENSLACCINLAYYTARKDYTIVREMPAGYGFADMVYIPKNGSEKPAMIIELKWNKDTETAIDQIKNNKYIDALDGYNGEVLLVGITYDKNAKAQGHRCKIEKIML